MYGVHKEKACNFGLYPWNERNLPHVKYIDCLPPGKVAVKINLKMLFQYDKKRSDY